MECYKYSLTNTGSTLVAFNYQSCEDYIWEYQVYLLPGQKKNIWLVKDTYQISEFFTNSVVKIDEGVFPPTNPNTPTVTPTPTQTINLTPSTTSSPTPTITSTSTLDLTPTPTNTPTSSITSTPTVTQTPTNTPTSTDTSTPTVTQTSTNTNTPTSSETSTPTVTPTNTNTPTYSPTSPSQEILIDPILAGIDEYIVVGNDEYLMFVDPISPSPSATPTPTITETPTTTPTETESPTPTPTTSVTPTITETPTTTPTSTVTPSSSPIPTTGYSFNLVALPYNFPTSGNTIMNGPGGSTSGSTDINALSGTSRGFYLNSIDSSGVDRTSYFSGFTGQSITISFTQTGNTAIYSGDTQSFKPWVQSPNSGFVFGTSIGVPPSGTPSGTAILIQAANAQFTIGLPVYVSLSINT